MIVYRELSSLVKDLGVSASALYHLSNSIQAHYHACQIPKRSGGNRVLNIPDPKLKGVQRAIAEKLLPLEPISHYAKAYKPGADIKKNAIPHLGKEKVLKLDILHFFDSILYSKVKDKAFPAHRYSEQNRILLSMLCYYKDSLPQGAPTSPAISNIVMYDFDETVGKWCKEKGITYTRYCDDMTFSGKFDTKEVVNFVSAELKKEGFLLNYKKTAVNKNSNRQCVTGLVVNDKVNTSSDYRRELRKEVYYCRRYGVEAHIKHLGLDVDKNTYLYSLLGKINFALHINPNVKWLSDGASFVKSQIK